MIRPLRTDDCRAGCRTEHIHGPSDIPRLREIFMQQKFEYSEPDWTKMVCAKVVADAQDRPRIALLPRPTVELYALVDREAWATPGLKAEQFARLDRAVAFDLKTQGYTDSHIWVPTVCRAFARRLQKFFGWQPAADPKDPWLGLVRYL